MLQVTEIRMDYLKNPVGVSGMPEFGWKIASDKCNVIQEAYQLQIAADQDFTRLVYDSGWVPDAESAHVKVRETPLSSCVRYFVRVRVRDGREESGFCEPGSFVTGILREEEWKAEFITAESREDRDRSASTLLRTGIELRGEVESAFACVTALGLYHFYINGEKAGEDEMTPGWTSYHKHLCYQTYDVTGALHPGRNLLGAAVGAGWYKGEMGFLHLRNNYGEQAAFLMQLQVRYRDGSQEWFVTDNSWTGHDGPVVFSEIYDGEIYDARLEIPGWNKADGAEVLGEAGPISMPGFAEADKAAALSQASGSLAGWRPVSVLPFPKKALTAQAGSRVKVMDRLEAVRVLRTPGGDTVLDFGQNLTGWITFRVNGRTGEKARLKCFETLDAAGNVYTANLRLAKQEITYICKGEGEESYHPCFTFQGFRYAQILEWPCEVRAEDFTACALHSEMEQTGFFTCSHPLVNQLHHNILWGLKGNFLDIPTDCPQRDERMGWTGDAQIFCRTACYLMNVDVFFHKWLKDVACDQTPEGGVPHVVPDIISGKEKDDWLLSQGTHSAAAWADVAVINPWTLYQIYGDKTILEEQYESMKKWIGFMRSHAHDNIWNYKLQFGDWVALDAQEGSYFGATPNDLTCTAYYAFSTGLFARIARVLGREKDAEEYEALYQQVVDKFRETFFREDGSMTAMTQTAHIVALTFDLVPEGLREQTAAALVELLRRENGHLVTGFVGTPYFCHALSRNGYVKEAYELLLKEDFPSWLYQVKMGATTVWEHWDGLKPDGTMWSPDMNSFNHYAYGAVGEWLYRVTLGMETSGEDPGFHHSIICPQPGDAFDYAEGSYESVYGRIAVRWDRTQEPDGEEIVLKITIPCNTTATVALEPGARPVEASRSGQEESTQSGQESGSQPSQEERALSFQEENGVQTARCGSGTYIVRYLRKQSAATGAQF